MILYILKLVAVSCLFILFYRVFMQNEKMFWLNRFYLLLTLILSVIIPFIPIDISSKQEVLRVIPVEKLNIETTTEIATSTLNNDLIFKLIYTLYALVSLVLVLRFTWNLLRILKRAKSANGISNDGYKLVLLQEDIAPHSFLNYVFVNKSDNLEQEVLKHELAHVRQRHSLDVIFIELFKIVFWFNPVFYWYKNYILLNHEFLADAEVLKSTNTSIYQNIILSRATQRICQGVSNSFNYSATKKRLNIMKMEKSPVREFTKCILMLSFSFAVVFGFGRRVEAQTKPVKESATENEMQEYHSLLDKYRDNGVIKFTNATDYDKKLIDSIFKKMTAKQKTTLKEWAFFTEGEGKLRPRIHQEDLVRWSESKKHQLFVDGKRIPNKKILQFKEGELLSYTLSSGKKGKYNVDFRTNNAAKLFQGNGGHFISISVYSLK